MSEWTTEGPVNPERQGESHRDGEAMTDFEQEQRVAFEAACNELGIQWPIEKKTAVRLWLACAEKMRPKCLDCGHVHWGDVQLPPDACNYGLHTDYPCQCRKTVTAEAKLASLRNQLDEMGQGQIELAHRVCEAEAAIARVLRLCEQTEQEAEKSVSWGDAILRRDFAREILKQVETK